MRALVLEDDERLRSLVVRTLDARRASRATRPSRIAEAEELSTCTSTTSSCSTAACPTATASTSAAARAPRGFRHSILMLTAMDQPEDEIEGLSEGADDYLGKPFDLEVLAARARALLRRNEVAGPAGARRPATCGSTRAAARPGAAREPLTLTSREFTILELLMRSPGARRLARGDPRAGLGRARGADVQHDRRARRAACGASSTGPKQPSRIETVRGMGYRLR